MDLHNNQITLGEILSYPPAREVLKQELPGLYGSPLMGMARGMSLQSVLQFAKGNVSPDKVRRVLEQLQSI